MFHVEHFRVVVQPAGRGKKPRRIPPLHARIDPVYSSITALRPLIASWANSKKNRILIPYSNAMAQTRARDARAYARKHGRICASGRGKPARSSRDTGPAHVSRTRELRALSRALGRCFLPCAYSLFRRMENFSGIFCRSGNFYLERNGLKSLCFQQFAAFFAFGTALATEAAGRKIRKRHGKVRNENMKHYAICWWANLTQTMVWVYPMSRRRVYAGRNYLGQSISAYTIELGAAL